MNYKEARLLEHSRKNNMGHFGYGDFGIANADKAYDDANTSWTEAQLNSAKAKWREAILALEQAIRDRNDTIDAIKQMPAGDEKNQVIGQFQEADSTLMQAYSMVQPYLSQLGVDLPSPGDANFGFVFPVIPLAAYGVLIAALAIIGTVYVMAKDSSNKYNAIMQNPKVAQYVQGGLFSSIGENLGSGLKYGIIAIAGVFAVSMLMKARKQ